MGELFAMVDSDIRDNGLWFDNVAVGGEWEAVDRDYRSRKAKRASKWVRR